MRILIVAATALEIAPLLQLWDPVGPRDGPPRGSHYRWHPALAGPSGHRIDVLITGVGMVATAAWTSRALAQTGYDIALNAGVCGSFTPRLPPGTVVHIVSDRIAELGVEDNDAFLTLEELELPGEHVFVNDAPPASAVLGTLPAVDGITVNTVHGRAQSIADIVARCHPDVESMEGAAFMQACRLAGVRYAQIRAVSNVVEPRNRGAWKLAEAVAAVNRTVRAVVEEL